MAVEINIEYPTECSEIIFNKTISDIRTGKILAVEGRDEYNFFCALLKHMRIKNFEIHDVAGKTQYKEKLPLLIKSSGFFNNAKVFAVIRDADTDCDQAFNSIKNIIEESGLTPPSHINSFSDGNPRVGIFILPGNSEKGMLEDLCLKTVENKPAMNCVNGFWECAKNLPQKPKNASKAKAQAYLAAMPEIVGSVGLGALNDYWNFNSPCLDELKKFLSAFS